MSKVGNGASAPMTPLQFVEKWKPVTLSERAAAQSHFCDVCRLLSHPDPVQADPSGEWFTFEKGVKKSGGGDGFADVWKRDYFAWEYKKKKRNLDEALGQLARYALALENPPLHIACDTDRFRIVTAWTNTVPRSFDLSLDDILVPAKLDILRSVFYDPSALRPGETRADLTEAAAKKFSSLSLRLQQRGNSPDDVAHFISRLVFLFFAEDVKLLPRNYFRRVLREMANKPKECKELLDGLFAVLRKGGRFGVDRLPHVNGGLFDERPALWLDDSEISLLIAAGSENWAHIDPSIFGTLFERLLDPDKRSQIGAHYTDPDKIMLILEPVLFRPLRREWSEAKVEIENLVTKANIKGSRALLPRFPSVGPEIIQGIELNPLAAELARTTIWIGDIQWHIQNGFYSRPEPILRPLETIACRNALIEVTQGNVPIEAKWPTAEFIVGNPPFLGIRLMRKGLGDETVEALFRVYNGRVSREADYVCYWFEKARAEISAGHTKRAGLVATNSIRGGANRRVLDKIAEENVIFDAWSDEAWVIEGAAVRVSIISFGKECADFHLNGEPVSKINANLTSKSFDITKVRALAENGNVSFMGDTKGGAFDIPGDLARKWLRLPTNPNGRTNSDVVRPWANGLDVTARPRDMWIISFDPEMSERDASLYEAPFEYIKEHVWPVRKKNRREAYRDRWWLHVEPRPGMWRALKGKERCIVTPETPTYTVFSWLPTTVLPDKNLTVITKSDYTTFGILQSRFHILWTRAIGSPYGNHPTAIRYNSTRIFQTFPFPDGLTPDRDGKLYQDDKRAIAIDTAARTLDNLRNAWINPPELVRVEPEVVTGYPDRVLPTNAAAESLLRERTLTELYNNQPQWLVDAHRVLDDAVANAYGWNPDLPDDDILSRLLALNLSRPAASETETLSPHVAKRKRRTITPDEIRQNPQFTFTIPGGKKKQRREERAPKKVSSRAPRSSRRGQS